MDVDSSAVVRALATLGVLLALPGLTVVRAPGPLVPFLSLGFWLVSWNWLEALHTTRAHFVLAALLFFGVLASLRLLKPLPRLLPGRPGALVALAALAQLLPLARLSLVPGDDGPLRALHVRLLVWHDGLPRTYEPLAPVHHFGAALHAVDRLAADVALLAGVPPALAALVAALAAQGLLLVALDVLLTRALRRPGCAADAARSVSAVVVLAVGGLRAAMAATTDSATLGLALGTCGAALLLRGNARAPAVAAGLLLAGSLAADPPLALLLPLGLSPALARVARARVDRRAQALRLGLAFGTAFALAAPALLRLALTLSPGERAGGLLLLARDPLPDLAWVAAALGAACLLARADRRGRDRPVGRTWPGLVAAFAAAAGTLWGAGHVRPRTPPGAADLRAFEALAASTSIDDVICIDASSAQVWIPALIGRAVQPAPLPGFYSDELRAAWARRPACLPAP